MVEEVTIGVTPDGKVVLSIGGQYYTLEAGHALTLSQRLQEAAERAQRTVSVSDSGKVSRERAGEITPKKG